MIYSSFSGFLGYFLPLTYWSWSLVTHCCTNYFSWKCLTPWEKVVWNFSSWVSPRPLREWVTFFFYYSSSWFHSITFILSLVRAMRPQTSRGCIENKWDEVSRTLEEAPSLYYPILWPISLWQNRKLLLSKNLLFIKVLARKDAYWAALTPIKKMISPARD